MAALTRAAGCFFVLLCLTGSSALAQAVFIDKPVQAGELILFPDINNPKIYYYLPNKVKLGLNRDNTPQFSFLRYVENEKTGAGDEQPRTEGEGGGIIHTVVQLEVTPEQLADAERELQRKVRGGASAEDRAVIQGPIIYKKGTMALISSAADKDGGFTKSIVGLGAAPIIAGNKAAVSVRLTKQGSKILWESFKTATPDMSFSFVMAVAGYRSPVNARVECDFDKIYEHKEFNAGVKVGAYVDASIEAAFDQLRDSGAIKITGVEASEKMQSIIETTYKKLIDIMFEPIQTNQAAPGAPGMAELATLMAASQNMQRGNSGQGQAQASAFKIGFGFKMKEVKKTGKFTLDLNKSMSDELEFRFDENFGSVKCPKCFREVNLDDPFWKQREVMLFIDGMDAEQFGKYINFVTVSLKKDHGEDAATVDEQKIAQKDFNAAGNAFRLMYGWKNRGDDDRTQWLQYQYKTVWSFFGGHQVVQEWAPSDQPALNLAPPFHPVSVSVEANPTLLANAQVRLVTVKFYYDYGAGEKMEQAVLRADDKNLAQRVDFMLKPNQYDYGYEVIWRLSGNRTMSTGRLTANDVVLYVDEIPEKLITGK